MTNQPKHNYIPGKAYKMRNGEKVVFVGENPFNIKWPLVFVMTDGTLSHNFYDGSYASTPNQPHKYDIIGEWLPEPKKIKRWVNIYKHDEACTHAFNTKQKCDNVRNTDRIACIPIEFTEGEGL